ncbi:MAG: cobalamin-dependent protein [Chloroflexi bacterium]|nr:cobalamin-dependent protein [Chloroflexota bacterium]
MSNDDEILANLGQAVITCNPEAASSWAKASLDAKIDPLVTLDALTKAIQSVGDAFGKGDCFLPELVGAAEAMSAATSIVEEQFQGRELNRKPLGVVVIGTVFGDLHSIGKDMVVALFKSAGFQVHDLGINVKAEEFVRAVNTTGAGLLALSALLTTTAPEQKKVIEALKREGIRDKVRVIVGGGAITRDFATNIGADGYESTAPAAVELAKRLTKV